MSKLSFHWAVALQASLVIHGQGQGAQSCLLEALIRFQQGEHPVTALEFGIVDWGDQLVQISALSLTPVSSSTQSHIAGKSLVECVWLSTVSPG